MAKVINFAEIDKIIDIQEQYINQLYKNEDYPKCYESCEYLLSLLPADKQIQRRVKKFCYLRQAVCLRKQFKFTEALDKAKMADKYCLTKDDHYSVVHLKAIVYKRLGMKDKALICINSCLKWYIENNMYYEIAMMLEIKGELLQQEKYFRESLENYNKALEEGKYFDKEMLQKEIDNVHQELIKLYIHIGEQNMLKAYRELNNITIDSMRNESLTLINKLYKEGVNE